MGKSAMGLSSRVFNRADLHSLIALAVLSPLVGLVLLFAAVLTGPLAAALLVGWVGLLVLRAWSVRRVEVRANDWGISAARSRNEKQQVTWEAMRSLTIASSARALDTVWPSQGSVVDWRMQGAATDMLISLKDGTHLAVSVTRGFAAQVSSWKSRGVVVQSM